MLRWPPAAIRAASSIAPGAKLGTAPPLVAESILKAEFANGSRIVSLPGSEKTTVCALLALHTACYEPGVLVLIVSPSLRQSGEMFRTVMGRTIRFQAEHIAPADSKLPTRGSYGSKGCWPPTLVLQFCRTRGRS